MVGGESGPGARPLERAWVESVRSQCRKASIPFFFKQWGGVRKKIAGRKLNGRTYNELPEIRKRLQPPKERQFEMENILRDSANLLPLALMFHISNYDQSSAT